MIKFYDEVTTSAKQVLRPTPAVSCNDATATSHTVTSSSATQNYGSTVSSLRLLFYFTEISFSANFWEIIYSFSLMSYGWNRVFSERSEREANRE